MLLPRISKNLLKDLMEAPAAVQAATIAEKIVEKVGIKESAAKRERERLPDRRKSYTQKVRQFVQSRY